MIKKLTIILFFTLWGISKLSAQMYLGGWMQYRYIGQNDYEIQLNVFTESISGALPQPYVTAKNKTTGNYFDTLWFKTSPDTVQLYQDELYINTSFPRRSIKRVRFIDTLRIIDTSNLCEVLLKYVGPYYSFNLTRTSAYSHRDSINGKLELFFKICDNNKNNFGPDQYQKHLIYAALNRGFQNCYASLDTVEQDSIEHVPFHVLPGEPKNLHFTSYYSEWNFMSYLAFPRRHLPFPYGLHNDRYGNLQTTPSFFSDFTLVSKKINEYRNNNGNIELISSGDRVFPLGIEYSTNAFSGFIFSEKKPLTIYACQKKNTPYKIIFSYKEYRHPPLVEIKASFGNVPFEIIKLNGDSIELNLFFDSLLKTKISNYSTLVLKLIDTFSRDQYFNNLVFNNSTFNIPVRLSYDSTYSISTYLNDSCNIINLSRDKVFKGFNNTWEISKNDSVICKIKSSDSSLINHQFLLYDSGYYRIKANTQMNGCDNIKDTLIYVNNERQKLLNAKITHCKTDSAFYQFPALNSDTNWTYFSVINNDTSYHNSLFRYFDSSQKSLIKNYAVHKNYSCVDSSIVSVFISDYKKNTADSFKVCGPQIFYFNSNATSKFNLQFKFKHNFTYNPDYNYSISYFKDTVFRYTIIEDSTCTYFDSIYIQNLLTQPIFKPDSDTTLCCRTNNGFINFKDLVNQPDSVAEYKYGSKAVGPINSIPIKNGKVLLIVTHNSGCSENKNYMISALGSNHVKNHIEVKVCRDNGMGLFTANPIISLVDTFGFYSSSGFTAKTTKFDVLNSQDSQIVFYTKFQGCESFDTIKIRDFNFKNKINVPEQLCNNQPNFLIRVDSGFYGGSFYLNDTLLINTLIPSTLINNNFINYKSFINAHIQCEQKFNFNVYPAPIADFTADITDGLKPLSVNFTNTSSDYSSFKWILPNSISDTTNSSLNYVFNDTGKYDIGIIVSNTACAPDTLIKTNLISVRTNVSKDVFNAYLKVYPNPVNNKLFIELMNQSEIKSIKIYDLQGKLMYEKKTDFNSNIEELDINLADGSYLLEVNSNNKEVYFSKFIVIKK